MICQRQLPSAISTIATMSPRAAHLTAHVPNDLRDDKHNAPAAARHANSSGSI
jgi:hypothetical protein